MCKALLFLHSLDDVRYAGKRLGFPLELVPTASMNTERRIRVSGPDDLESAYRELCSINMSEEFTAVRN